MTPAEQGGMKMEDANVVSGVTDVIVPTVVSTIAACIVAEADLTNNTA